MNHGTHEIASPPGKRRDEGYILLVLLLFVALLSIGFMTMVRKIDFQIKRDREEELIHRGVQYSRAVRRYFKKFGRYPTRIEDLENTNNLRFLRKRYKDPISGKDFKLLHLTDLPQIAALGPNLSNTAVTGVNGLQSPVRTAGGGNFGPGGGNFGPSGGNFGPGGGGRFGPGGGGSFGPGGGGSFGPGGGGSFGPGGGGSFGPGGRGSFGPGAMSSFPTQQPGAPGALNGMASAPAGPGPSAIAGSDSSQPGEQGDASTGNQANPSGPGSGASLAPHPLAQQIGPTGGPQVFGGGAIVGVTSLSKEQSIREFNKKNHYNEWQFVYDPTTDRGGLLMTPNQPPLKGAVPASQMQSQSGNGQPGLPPVNQGFGVNQPTQAPSTQTPPPQ